MPPADILALYRSSSNSRYYQTSKGIKDLSKRRGEEKRYVKMIVPNLSVPDYLSAKLSGTKDTTIHQNIL